MPEASKCGDCGGKLGVKATKCRCGWVMPGAPRDSTARPVRVISCCFSSCLDGAICRIFTKTGWANVCRGHYRQVAREAGGYMPRSETAAAIRKIYEGSYHYRRKHGQEKSPAERSQLDVELEAMRQRMQAGRQPGQDDEPVEYTPDMPVSDYELYIEGLANP